MASRGVPLSQSIRTESSNPFPSSEESRANQTSRADLIPSPRTGAIARAGDPVRKPPMWMKPGEVVEVEIDGGLGVLPTLM